MCKPILSYERLRELLDYDPETGVFTRKISRGGVAIAGKQVGNNAGGYLTVSINKRNEYLHRLAWLFTYGKYPEGVIDHINGKKDDNRLKNLRDVSRSSNQHNMPARINNGVGCPGVSWSNSTRKWRARITVQHKEIYLGVFPSLTEAISARQAAKLIYHPSAPVAQQGA